jgi:hypothetical protein
MGCLFALFAGVFPRLAVFIVWIARPERVDAAFSTFLWPLLGIILGCQRHPAQPDPGQTRLGGLGASGPAGVGVANQVGVHANRRSAWCEP